MKFDDINLNDDKNAPKLDLDFGLGNSGASDKKSGGFSFGGGWGGGWGATDNSWGFSGVDEKSNKKNTMVEDSSWNFNSTGKKDKKKSNGFDFDFDNLGGGDDLGLGKPAAKEDKAVEDDPW